jgi:fucose 4-O-acetylase-like acetyltransferase
MPGASTRTRDKRVDSLRAAAIVAVVLGHAITVAYGSPRAAPAAAGVVFTACAALGVPSFMFLSGWVARRRAGVTWVAGRVVRLLVPYAAWCALQWLVWWRAEGPARLLTMLVYPSTTNALWFLPALFLCSVAFAALSRSDALLIAAAVACALWAPRTGFLGLANTAPQLPLFVAGYYASKARAALKPLAMASPLLAAASWGGPGVGMQRASPAWFAAWSRLAAAAPAAVVAAPLHLAHTGAMLGVVSLAFLLAWPGSGALPRAWEWLARGTLGVYLGHIFFLRLVPAQGLAGVALTFAVATAGGVALTWLARLTRPTALVFLGER